MVIISKRILKHLLYGPISFWVLEQHIAFQEGLAYFRMKRPNHILQVCQQHSAALWLLNWDAKSPKLSLIESPDTLSNIKYGKGDSVLLK